MTDWPCSYRAAYNRDHRRRIHESDQIEIAPTRCSFEIGRLMRLELDWREICALFSMIGGDERPTHHEDIFFGPSYS
jgi:hypothetical protein